MIFFCDLQKGGGRRLAFHLEGRDWYHSWKQATEVDPNCWTVGGLV